MANLPNSMSSSLKNNSLNANAQAFVPSPTAKQTQNASPAAHLDTTVNIGNVDCDYI